jgi:ABC-2 type transport system ATP-binding protein
MIVAMFTGPEGSDRGQTGEVPPTIQARGLCRSFGPTVALDGLDVDVEPGEVVALLGPNGAGKTTTVRLLNGVLRPDAGWSRVLGLDPAVDGDAVRRSTGVMTESSGLDDRLTALQNVVTYARIRGTPAAVARQRGAELLERFGLGDRLDRSVQGASTGQRKRVALARALLHDPEVLFLDEPTSGLDPAATREVIDLMAALAREEGRTIVLCTHFLTEACRLCPRVVILEQGRLVAAGRPEDLAAGLWPGLAVDVELGAPADPGLLAGVQDVAGVLSAEAAPTGARVRVADREVLPRLVAALVTREVAVYAVTPRPATLEEVYFALTGRAAVEAVE